MTKRGENMARRERSLNMTEGVIWKVLLLFFLPIMAGNLLQQLYAAVDAVVVGRFAGKTGLAAIDAVMAMLRLPVNIFGGLATGATILISQYFGAGEERELDKSIHTALAFSLAGGGVLSVVGFFLAPQCLHLLAVPKELLPSALGYTRIYFAGFVVSMLYNVSAGVLRAMGDAQTPFKALGVACILNIVLDLLMVGVLGWGTAGAALATVIAQGVSALVNLRSLSRPESPAHFRLNKLAFHGSVLRRMLTLGLPLSLQGGVYPLANMVIQTSINLTGTDNIAAWALCGKLDMLIWMCADSIPGALSTFVAQNHGAGRDDRVRQGTWTTMAIAVGLVGALSAGLYFFTADLGKLFIAQADWDILPLAARFMRIEAPFYWTYVVGETLSSSVRGLGDTLKPMLLTVLGTCGLRLAWIALVTPLFPGSMEAIVWVFPLSWLATSLLFTGYYLLFYRRKRSPAQA